jgi:hypothetical protein
LAQTGSVTGQALEKVLSAGNALGVIGEVPKSTVSIAEHPVKRTLRNKKKISERRRATSVIRVSRIVMIVSSSFTKAKKAEKRPAVPPADAASDRLMLGLHGTIVPPDSL